MKIEDIELFLPKYLSTDSTNAMVDALRSFPEIDNSRFYTSYLASEPIIFQGDGLKSLLFVDAKTLKQKNGDGMILSNTCDIAQENQRDITPRIVYTPIIAVDKFCNWLKEKLGKSEEYINSLLTNIRKQYNTSIFYLPENGSIPESIVFLDNLQNIRYDEISHEKLQKVRIFTLSNVGLYIFLFKISFHFCRIQEKIDRDQGRVIR